MKFSVGYQITEEGEDESFADIVRDFQDRIAEVYFPWLDLPSGRSPMTMRDGFVDWTGQQKLESDLKAFKKMGIKLNLLLNANCYGAHGLSEQLENRVCSIIAHLFEETGLDSVTAASLMIARAIKKNFPQIDVRASVNMRLGEIKAFQYVEDLFDSFNLQREYNRDLQKIAEIKGWTDSHGKKLYLLANSGCLNFCSGQVFHDNLVAHESEIMGMRNIRDWNPSVCWNYYANRKHWVAFLQNSWIRPEDLHHYEKLFPVVKLATRMHANPRKVIRAYCEGHFNGNLLDLLEPGHGPVFQGYIINNAKFPKDWFEKTTACRKKCDQCDYCSRVLKEVLERIE